MNFLLTPRYLEILSNYIISAIDSKEQKQTGITNENRLKTINRHETSYQGLASSFEQGEDGLYNLIIDNDKNIYLTPQPPKITEEVIEEIPELRQVVDAIDELKKQLSKETNGRKRYSLKNAIIEL